MSQYRALRVSTRRMLPCAVATATALLLAACGASSSVPASAPVAGGFGAHDSLVFESLPEVVATADLLVEAKVTKVLPGRIVDDPGTSYDTKFVNVTLDVERVLNGKPPSGTVVVETLELAYARPNRDWRLAGTRVLAALDRAADGRPIYWTTNLSQSIFLVQSGEIDPVLVGADQDPLVQHIVSIAIEDFRREVDDAKASIGRGEVNPRVKPTIEQDAEAEN